MIRGTRWIAPAAALVLVLGLGWSQSMAQDATVTAGKANITVTVVDSAGKPVVGATVNLMPPHAKKDKTAGATTQPAEAHKPTVLETGTTDANGTFTLKNVANGDYVVAARLKGSGAGRSKVQVTDDKDQTLSLTLNAAKLHTHTPATN